MSDEEKLQQWNEEKDDHNRLGKFARQNDLQLKDPGEESDEPDIDDTDAIEDDEIDKAGLDWKADET